MERTAQKSPLPCYALEHDRLDPRCQACPHFDGCLEHMGSRADKIPLNRVKFDTVPEQFRQEAFDMEDPELPHLQRLYADCYLTVFEKNPTDNVTRISNDIAVNARQSQCSVRMFMLANMIAHKIHESTVISHTEKLRSASFKSKLLAGELSIKRAKTYQQMCHDQFGTFSLTSLAILTDSDSKDDLESIMLSSEITAASWFIRYKILNGGPGEKELYESEELRLAPEWLAIEQSYIDTIIKPFTKKQLKSTDAVERHRYSVVQMHGHYKRHLSNQRIAWLARQRALPEALKKIVNLFNVQPQDFMYPRIPVTNPMRFWLTMALTLRQYHCWLYLNDQSSFFTPRRRELLIPNSSH